MLSTRLCSRARYRLPREAEDPAGAMRVSLTLLGLAPLDCRGPALGRSLPGPAGQRLPPGPLPLARSRHGLPEVHPRRALPLPLGGVCHRGPGGRPAPSGPSPPPAGSRGPPGGRVSGRVTGRHRCHRFWGVEGAWATGSSFRQSPGPKARARRILHVSRPRRFPSIYGGIHRARQGQELSRLGTSLHAPPPLVSPQAPLSLKHR